MDAAMSSARSSPAAVKVLLLLTLSPAAASKVIAKARKKRARLQANVAGGGGADSAAPFQCRTCGRRFATFQALGGHRTSHKRPRVRADGLDLLLGAHPGTGAARVPSRPVVHRCGHCGQTFATGQALGGHMRRHRPPGTAEAIGTSSLSSGLSLSAGPSDDDENDEWPTLIHFI